MLRYFHRQVTTGVFNARKIPALSSDVISNDRDHYLHRYPYKHPLTRSGTIEVSNYSSTLRTPSPHSRDNTCLIYPTYAVNFTSLALNISITFLLQSFEDVTSERIKVRGRCTAGKTTISLYGLSDKTCGAVCFGGLLEDPSHLVCATKSERTAAAALMLICYRFPRVVGIGWVFGMESTGVRGMTFSVATTCIVPRQPPSAQANGVETASYSGSG